MKVDSSTAEVLKLMLMVVLVLLSLIKKAMRLVLISGLLKTPLEYMDIDIDLNNFALFFL